jgi:hypothetical protein
MLLMVRAFINTKMAPFIKANGSTANKTVWVRSLGLTNLTTLESIRTDARMALDCTLGRKARLIKASGKTILSRVTVSIPGQMVVVTQVSGKTEQWKEWAAISGLMASVTKGTSSWI